MPDKALTLTQVAERLQVSEKTLTGLVKKGEVPHFRVGRQYRFLENDIQQWIENIKKGSKD